jgi:hypothetical protein
MSTFFPNEKFGGDFKTTATYRAYKKGIRTVQENLQKIRKY